MRFSPFRAVAGWHFSLCCVLAAVVSASFVGVGCAQEDPSGKSAKPGAAPAKPEATDAKPEADPLALPEPATKEALLKFTARLEKMDPDTLPQYILIQQATLKAADALLNIKDLKTAEAIAAAELKFRALAIMSRFSVKNMDAKFQAFAKELAEDKRPEVAALGKRQLLIGRIRSAGDITEKEQQALVDELSAKMKAEGVTVENFPLAIGLGEVIEASAEPAFVAKTYNAFAALAKTSEDKRIIDYANILEGTARRVTLPGNTMKIVGKTIDGEKFNWDSYRGKVVLVDFWATWCGPCREEFPNVLANYKAWHDKGFEVVGISIDDNPQAVQKFLTEGIKLPWTTIWNEEHVNANYYGINAIPAVFLVDAEGKVVSTNARGNELGRLLKEMLGKPAESKDEQPKPE